MSCWDYHCPFRRLIVYLRGIQWNVFLHRLRWRRTIWMGMQDCWHRYLASDIPLGHSSDFSFHSAVDSPTGLPQAGSQTPVPRWCFAREGPFMSELPQASRVSAVDVPSAIQPTGPQTSLNPPGSMGCRCTTPDFWNGSALRSRLDYWIKVLVLGCTRDQAIDTGTCAS